MILSWTRAVALYQKARMSSLLLEKTPSEWKMLGTSAFSARTEFSVTTGSGIG
jgi:hypothetical protein